METHLLRKLIKKIIREQYSPYSSFHKYDVANADGNIQFTGVLYSSFIEGWVDDGPGGEDPEVWANYENSTNFYEFIQEPNVGEWRKIINSGLESCIQFKGASPPLETPGPNRVLQGPIIYGGEYSDLQACINAGIPGDDGNNGDDQGVSSGCDVYSDGPCATTWFGPHADKPQYINWMQQYVFGCGGNKTFEGIENRLLPQYEAIMNSYSTGGTLPYLTEIVNAQNWNQLSSAINSYASYVDMSGPDRGRLKRKLAKRLWATCMKQSCCI